MELLFAAVELINGKETKLIPLHSLQWMEEVELSLFVSFPPQLSLSANEKCFLCGRRARQPFHSTQLIFLMARSGPTKDEWVDGLAAGREPLGAPLVCLLSPPPQASFINSFSVAVGEDKRRSLWIGAVLLVFVRSLSRSVAAAAAPNPLKKRGANNSIHSSEESGSIHFIHFAFRVQWKQINSTISLIINEMELIVSFPRGGPMLVNSFISFTSSPIRKSELREEMRVEWAGPLLPPPPNQKIKIKF